MSAVQIQRPIPSFIIASMLTIVMMLVGPTPSVIGQSATPPAAQTAAAESAEAHLGRGYDALKQDRYQVAADEFRAALALDPSLVLRARFPLAVALFEQHKSTEARRELEAVRHET